MKECKRCNRQTLNKDEALNALSRRDNKTYICSDCGTAEAMIDAGLAPISDIERNFIITVKAEA